MNRLPGWIARTCLAGLLLGALLLPYPQDLVYGGAAESVEIPSSLNPVGSGARALGMGGAFIAVADDATAASWNPGGLIQLERPEVSAVGEAFHRIENNFFGNHPEGSGRQPVTAAGLNYLSAAYPFTVMNHNMIVSFNYQHLYDFTRQWDFRTVDKTLRRTWDYEQNGGLYAYGLAYCVQIAPRFSFGFTLNLWDDGIYDNGWSQRMVTHDVTKDVIGREHRVKSDRSDQFSFKGFNANVGMLWDITGQLTLGAVFKTPFTADLEHELVNIEKLERRPAKTTRRNFDEELDMPMSYGLGVAYRFSDEFTLSADVYRTEWGDFVQTNSDGQKISPVSGLPLAKSDVSATTQVRLGGEYLFIKEKYLIPVRAGFFYDPAPAEGGSDDYFGFSLGSGIGVGPFIFDVAYQYRFGRGVGTSIFRQFKFSQDIDEHTIYSSLIYHF